MATPSSAPAAAAAASAQPKNRAGFVDISSSISRSECYCLNEQPSAPFTNLFIGDETLLLKSDADEQLILHIEFQDAVKIHSIRVIAPPGETAPRVLKLYANRSNLGFSDASDIEPTQTIEFDDAQELTGQGQEVELRFVKFQRVKGLTIFVEENHGADETAIASIKLFGENIAGTNMNELKKVSEE